MHQVPSIANNNAEYAFEKAEPKTLEKILIKLQQKENEYLKESAKLVEENRINALKNYNESVMAFFGNFQQPAPLNSFQQQMSNVLLQQQQAQVTPLFPMANLPAYQHPYNTPVYNMSNWVDQTNFYYPHPNINVYAPNLSPVAAPIPVSVTPKKYSPPQKPVKVKQQQQHPQHRTPTRDPSSGRAVASKKVLEATPKPSTPKIQHVDSVTRAHVKPKVQQQPQMLQQLPPQQAKLQPREKSKKLAKPPLEITKKLPAPVEPINVAMIETPQVDVPITAPIKTEPKIKIKSVAHRDETENSKAVSWCNVPAKTSVPNIPIKVKPHKVSLNAEVAVVAPKIEPAPKIEITPQPVLAPPLAPVPIATELAVPEKANVQIQPALAVATNQMALG